MRTTCSKATRSKRRATETRAIVACKAGPQSRNARSETNVGLIVIYDQHPALEDVNHAAVRLLIIERRTEAIGFHRLNAILAPDLFGYCM